MNNPSNIREKTLVDDQTLSLERSVLGSCICFPERLRDCEDLEVDDFVDLRHKSVFAALRNLEATNKPIDVLSVEIEVNRIGKLDAIGGVAFLGELILAFPTIDNFLMYVGDVRDRALRRRIAVVAGNLVEIAMRAGCTGAELLDLAGRNIAALESSRPNESGPVAIGELVAARFENVERIAAAQATGEAGALTGAPTGVDELDRKLGGWRFKIGNLIAARPGMGKSSLGIATADACSAIADAHANIDMGVHVFSLEDSIETYGDRVLAGASGVPAIRLRQADLRPGDAGACVDTVHRFRARRFWEVDDTAALSAVEIVRRWRRARDRIRTRVVIVDYLQLMRSPDPRLREDQAIGMSLQTLIDAARADDIALVVMSQFNRELEKRVDKRPQLADLRGSGEIEEKVKLAVGIYRGSYYGGRPIRGVDYDCSCPESVKSCYHAPTAEDWARQAQLLVLKGGNGPVGVISASWHGPTMKFS